MIIIGDVHGCLKELKELIKLLPQDRELCFVGDLIDRGPNSSEVVSFVRENDHKIVLGNHEDMCIRASAGDRYYYEMWMNNGGRLSTDIEKHLEWMKSLPLTVRHTNSKGEEFIISHSIIADVAHLEESDPMFVKHCLWSRPHDVSFSKDVNFTNIVGHTPVESVVKIENTVFIDTGCVYHKKLSAYDTETGKTWSVNYA